MACFPSAGRPRRLCRRAVLDARSSGRKRLDHSCCSGGQSMKRVRTAIVGAGAPNIATANHIPATLAVPELELIALCDVSEGVTEYAARYGVDAYTDYKALLERDDLDMVQLCTPDFLHATQAIQATQAGKHVLIEKPMAISYAEARAVRRAVDQAGIKAEVVQNKRWEPRSLCMKALINGGAIGTPVYAFYSSKGRFYPYPREHYCRHAAYGGQFVHNGVHYVDLLSFLIDSLPEAVFGRTTSYYPGDDRMETDNYTVSQIRFESGALGVVELNQLLLEPPGFPPTEAFFVIGTKGILHAGHADRSPFVTFIDGHVGYGPPAMRDSPAQDPFALLLRDFALAILEDRQPSIPISESTRILDACLVTLDSARLGHPLRLGEEIPIPQHDSQDGEGE